jgi:hypothetical protein
LPKPPPGSPRIRSDLVNPAGDANRNEKRMGDARAYNPDVGLPDLAEWLRRQRRGAA